MKIINSNKKNWEVPDFKVFRFKPKRADYCLIIPVINEGDKIKSVVRELKNYSKILDVVIADGGSTDDSLEKNFLHSHGVNSLLVKTGAGKLGAQYRMAFYYALERGYKGVITMDGNGKDDTDSLTNFIAALKGGYDYVQGSRFIRGGKAVNTPLIRLLAIRLLFSPILSLGAWHWYADVTNGHRAYSRKLLLHPKLKLFRNIFARYEILFYITARANKLGLKTLEIPVARIYPKGKTPTKIVGFSKMIDVVLSAVRASTGYYNP